MQASPPGRAWPLRATLDGASSSSILDLRGGSWCLTVSRAPAKPSKTTSTPRTVASLRQLRPGLAQQALSSEVLGALGHPRSPAPASVHIALLSPTVGVMQYGTGMGLPAHRASLDRAVAKAKRASRASSRWLQVRVAPQQPTQPQGGPRSARARALIIRVSMLILDGGSACPPSSGHPCCCRGALWACEPPSGRLAAEGNRAEGCASAVHAEASAGGQGPAHSLGFCLWRRPHPALQQPARPARLLHARV